MHQADTAATCHMGRQALCPHQLIASSRWTKLESPSRPTLSRPPRRKDTNVWPSSWIGVLNVIGRANRHMHPGLPEEHRPLLHAPCPKQAPLRKAARQGMPAHIHQPARRSTILDTPPRPAGARANRARAPSPPKRRRRVRSYLRPIESTSNTKERETDAQASKP